MLQISFKLYSLHSRNHIVTQFNDPLWLPKIVRIDFQVSHHRHVCSYSLTTATKLKVKWSYTFCAVNFLIFYKKEALIKLAYFSKLCCHTHNFKTLQHQDTIVLLTIPSSHCCKFGVTDGT
jgi:hypothetical protein